MLSDKAVTLSNQEGDFNTKVKKKKKNPKTNTTRFY